MPKSKLLALALTSPDPNLVKLSLIVPPRVEHRIRLGLGNGFNIGLGLVMATQNYTITHSTMSFELGLGLGLCEGVTVMP